MDFSQICISISTLPVIKTHDSESRGQEEAAVRDERVSYLQAAQKFADAVTNPP